MPDVSPLLALPLILPAQAQKHVTHNSALDRLDMLVQLVVEGFEANTPPASPVEGQVWALGALPTGAWAGQAQQLASFRAGAWTFVTPAPGWRAWGRGTSQLRVFAAGAWGPLLGAGDLQNLPGVGVNASADATNRLAVSAPASLFTHQGAGHQVKVNKAAPADTASLLFQSGWSGRAELGLAGSDDFTLKVSADGGAFFTALQATRATGAVSLPNGLAVTGAVTGSAVQSDGTDTTPGRLVRLSAGSGVFGLGLPDTSLALPPGDSLTALRVSGLYRFASTTLGKPAAAAGVVLHAVRLAGTGAATHLQMALTNAAATPLLVRRLNTDGSWTAWSSGLFQENLLGTVSQSGNIPTGAVIERGSSANGRYVRFADGTQICSHVQVAETAAAATWTFPAEFIAAGDVTATVTPVFGAARIGGIAAITSTALTFNSWTTGGSRSNESCRLLAVGRWFAVV